MALRSKKIVVLGSTGQVGKSFYERWHTWPNVVFACRNPPDGSHYTVDLSRKQSLTDLFLAVKPDIIVNCAAYTAVDLAETHYDDALQINGRAVDAMARWCQDHHSIFIHYSTDYVFDGSGHHQRYEDDPIGPVNAYGKSKLAGEEAVINHPSNSYIFRTQWVYDSTGSNFLNTMLRLGRLRTELSVVSDQIGAPTPAGVISEFTEKALVKILNHQLSPGIYHLACRGEISWYDFANKIFELAHQRGDSLMVTKLNAISSEAYPTPARRPKNSRLSLQKLEAALGENLPIWDDALRSVML